MIKRTASTILLLLAGILFLAHAVVPHHHHANMICFASSHCENDGSENNHENSPDDHHHDGEDCSDHCILKEPVIVNSNQYAGVLKFIEKKSAHGSDDNLKCSLPSDMASVPAPDLQNIFSSPPVSFFRSSLSSASPGLRAPPTV